MASGKQQSKGGIIDAGDLRYFLRIFSKNWYLVVIALLVSAVLSYLYSYKIPEVYGASTQILLKDKDVYNYQQQVYANIGYTGVYGDIVNQKIAELYDGLKPPALHRLDAACTRVHPRRRVRRRSRRCHVSSPPRDPSPSGACLESRPTSTQNPHRAKPHVDRR